MQFLKKYWPLLIVGSGYLVLWVNYLLAVLVAPFSSRMFWMSMALTAVGIIGITATRVLLDERWYAKVLLGQITPEARAHGLQQLANALDLAYRENIHLQRGDMEVTTAAPPSLVTEPDDVAKFYQKARRREERTVAARIELFYDNFWGAAKLLHFGWRHVLPTSYKEYVSANVVRPQDGTTA